MCYQLKIRKSCDNYVAHCAVTFLTLTLSNILSSVDTLPISHHFGKSIKLFLSTHIWLGTYVLLMVIINLHSTAQDANHFNFVVFCYTRSQFCWRQNYSNWTGSFSIASIIHLLSLITSRKNFAMNPLPIYTDSVIYKICNNYTGLHPLNRQLTIITVHKKLWNQTGWKSHSGLSWHHFPPTTVSMDTAPEDSPWAWVWRWNQNWGHRESKAWWATEFTA